MSALLLTVVILGVLVAAVVADLVGGPAQPATTSPRDHRDYKGPWESWLHALQGLVTRTGQRVGRGFEVIGAAIEKGVRAALTAAQSGVTAVRESREGIAARRRALKERHAAHLRHVVHLDETIAPEDQPEPYPLPPPLPELEEHEKMLRQNADTVELPRRAVRLPEPSPPPGPGEVFIPAPGPAPASAPGPASDPGPGPDLSPGPVPDPGPGVDPGPGPGPAPDPGPGIGPHPGPGPGVAAPMPAGVGTGTALRERPVVPPTVRGRRAGPQPRPHKAHLPAPPTATRIRSALVLVVMMSALGAVVTAVFLGVLLLVVRALSGV